MVSIPRVLATYTVHTIVVSRDAMILNMLTVCAKKHR